MKILIFTAIFATVASNSDNNQWPWQVGVIYHYNVTSHTMSSFEQGTSNGHALKTQFIISVAAPGRLLVKLEHSQYVAIKAHFLHNWELPSDVHYQPFKDLDHTFEVLVSGGRIDSIKFQSSLSFTLENVLKGLIGALQLDLSNTNNVQVYPNSDHNGTFQGVFMKMETDVTGTCETLYSISPMSPEWRREIHNFKSNEDPIEIVKSRNYGNCQVRIGSVSGLPDDAVWARQGFSNEERQFITHSSGSRLLVDKRGTIYKSQVVGIVYASPMIYGKQKAEVYSHTEFLLNSATPSNTITQTFSRQFTGRKSSFRSVNSLLYTDDPSTNFYIPGDQQNVAKAKKLLQEISTLLQDPNDMPKKNFLIKFNVLVNVLAALNAKQLAELTSNIRIPTIHQNNDNNNIYWFIYRDALALAGTPEAFQQIKSWISSKKVDKEEAAELIATIGASVSKPSRAYLEEFFKFSTCDQVSKTHFLHNSALLALTKLLRLAEDDKFTVKTVIPYLSEQLKNGVKSKYMKPLVYVTALGNLAHPAVLNVFAPYLEGQISITKYLRTHMVTNLKNLASKKDPYVRSVLYSIIKNTGEPYEVRVAAAQNIFLAFPTFDMMRVLAYMAKNDLSTQVRAVLKSGITFAAELKDPRFTVLSKTAQAVLNLLTEEKFGSQYSYESLHDGYSGDDEFSFFKEQSYIGSDDYFLHKFHRTALRFMGTGLTEENQITLSISSFRKVMSYLYDKLYSISRDESGFPTVNRNNLNTSVDDVIRMLNIKRKVQDPLEAAVFIEILNQQRIFTMDDFSHFTLFSGLENNYNFQHTKILYNKKISVAFPLASGMPFAFEYREPIAGQVNLRYVIKNIIKIETAVTFARSIDGAVGYVDTLGKTFASAGIINHFQIHLPFKLELDARDKALFGPLHPGKTENIVHFSVLPYTGALKQNSVDSNVEFIKRSIKTVSTDVEIGGMFQFQASSYSTDYKRVEDMFKNDILTTVGTLMHQKDVAYTQIEFNYLGSKANIKTVSFAHFYFEGSMLNYNNYYKFLWSVELDYGTKTEEYGFTAECNYNHVDSKFLADLEFVGMDNHSHFQAVFKYDTSEAKIVSLNFENALKNDIKVTYEVQIHHKKTNINLQGYGIRSKEYTELLKKDPMAKRCLKDMSKENYYQLDCHNMIVKAYAPDYFKAIITYKNFDFIPIYHTSSYVYKALKKAYSWEEEINPFEKILGDKFEIEAQAFYNENFGNYKLLTKYGLLKLDNVKGLWYPTGMSVIGPGTVWDHAKSYYTGYQQLPYCAVDGSKVRTFSGRSYDYVLTRSWHVVMVDRENYLGQNLVILARRPSPRQMEIYISLSSGHHGYIELNYKNGTITSNTDCERSSEGTFTRYWGDRKKAPMLEYYSLADGTRVFQIHNGHIRLITNQRSLAIFTEDFRSTTKGICGENTGQVQDDYMTPWGLVDRPDHYGASFSLDLESDPQTQALKRVAKLKAYEPVIRFTKIPRYEDWVATQNNSVFSGIFQL